MAKKSRKETRPEKEAVAAAPLPGWIPWAALGVALLLFYWAPLFTDGAIIHWDAVDVHLSSQRYLSEHLRDGKLPFWTPYIFSGFPFLADPQVGAFYPPHAPFFLAGVGPKAIQWEIVLHVLLAAVGAFLLARRLIGDRWSALFAAIAYGFGGFFAAHASHVGMVETAAWLPWLLIAVERGGAAGIAAAGVIGGTAILAGHFQSSLYLFFGAGLYAAATQWRRIGTVAAAAAIAAALSAIQWWPGAELASHSIRATADYSQTTNAALEPRALATLFYANALGAVEGRYTGPEDITQFYFYGGMLLLPLAALGLRNPRVRWGAAALIVVPLWYALGPSGGLYYAIAALPGFSKVRAPVHVWFVVALGLALLGAAGVRVIREKWNAGWVTAALLAFAFFDLFLWNSVRNPMAYERKTWAERYTIREQVYRDYIAKSIPAGTRLHIAAPNTSFGSLNGPLDQRVETTYGYNPLELQHYADYIAAAQANPKLIDGLNAGVVFDLNAWKLGANPAARPRAEFPKRVIAGGDWRTLDPAEAAIAERAVPTQDASATAHVTAIGEDYLAVKYKCATESLLRVSIPYYPGWTAGAHAVVRVDHALSGVVLPAGEGEVRFEYRPARFLAGAAVSAFAGLVCAALLLWASRRRPAAPPLPQ